MPRTSWVTAEEQERADLEREAARRRRITGYRQGYEEGTVQRAQRQQESEQRAALNRSRQQIEEDYARARQQAIRETPVPTRPPSDWSEAVAMGEGKPGQPMRYRGTPDEAGQESIRKRQARLTQIEAARKQAIGEKLPLSMRQILANYGGVEAQRKLEEYRKGLTDMGLAPDEIERKVGEFQRQTFGAGRRPDAGTGQATDVFELPGQPLGELSVRDMLLAAQKEQVGREREQQALRQGEAFDPSKQKERMAAGKPIMSGLGQELVMRQQLTQAEERERIRQVARTEGERQRLQQKVDELAGVYQAEGVNEQEARRRALKEVMRIREPEVEEPETHLMLQPHRLTRQQVDYGIRLVDAASGGDSAALGEILSWLEQSGVEYTDEAGTIDADSVKALLNALKRKYTELQGAARALYGEQHPPRPQKPPTVPETPDVTEQMVEYWGEGRGIVTDPADPNFMAWRRQKGYIQ